MALALKTARPKCQICKRRLTDSESIARGTGPECAGKLAEINAAYDAGVKYLQTSGDYKLAKAMADVKQLDRIGVARGTNDPRWHADMHAARVAVARRATELAKQGFLTIQFPAAPNTPDVSESEIAPSLSDYEIANMAVKAAEQRYQREYNDPQSTHFVEAVLSLQEAKRARAQAALAEVQSRQYAVRRTRFSDGAAAVLRAPKALAEIKSDLLDDHDVVPDDVALCAGLPVYTFEAMYHAVL